jgi:thioredoxin 1
MLVRARSNVFTLLSRLPNKPVLVYFTTPDCVPCKTVQRPAIERVSNVLGEKLEVIEINAYDQPELAQTWGVMSVPTTFLLDTHGEARYVNNGVARAEKLLEQIQTL